MDIQNNEGLKDLHSMTREELIAECQRLRSERQEVGGLLIRIGWAFIFLGVFGLGFVFRNMIG